MISPTRKPPEVCCRFFRCTVPAEACQRGEDHADQQNGHADKHRHSRGRTQVGGVLKRPEPLKIIGTIAPAEVAQTAQSTAPVKRHADAIVTQAAQDVGDPPAQGEEVAQDDCGEGNRAERLQGMMAAQQRDRPGHDDQASHPGNEPPVLELVLPHQLIRPGGAAHNQSPHRDHQRTGERRHVEHGCSPSVEKGGSDFEAVYCRRQAL